MKEGGKSQLFIPHNLAYNKRGPLAHRTLIFEVELIAVETPEQAASQDQPQDKSKEPDEAKAGE